MFVDASALVAMILGEPDSGPLTLRLESRSPHPRRTSPLAVFETTAAVSRVLALSIADAEEAVNDFLKLTAIRVVPIPVEAGPLALEAFGRYGKGRGQPARLNMGDCFAYACARHFRERLLFKGDDFAKTDIESAMFD